MSTDRLPAIVLRDRDSIANGIVLVDANAVLALDRHIGLYIAAVTEKIIPTAQIFAFDLRGHSQACVVNLLVILWRCLRCNLSFRGRSTVFALRPGSLTLMDIERFIGRCGRSRFALRLPGPRIKVGPRPAVVAAQFAGRRYAFQRLIMLFDRRRIILPTRGGPIQRTT